MALTYQQISGEEIHSELLNLLIRFDDLCTHQHLRYSLAGGTMLGAIRHKGFIPWDDDADVCMPRPDYELLLEYMRDCNGCSEYYLEPEPNPKDRCSPMAKFMNRNVLVEDEYAGGKLCLWIDVLPVDGLPANETGLKHLYTRANLLRRLALASYARHDRGKTKLHRIMKRCLGIIDVGNWLGNLAIRRLYILCKRINYATSKYVGILSFGLYGIGERVPRDEFERLVDLEFEGRSFKGMACWDQYLTGLYGEYMVLPPENERRRHDIKVWKRVEDKQSD